MEYSSWESQPEGWPHLGWPSKSLARWVVEHSSADCKKSYQYLMRKRCLECIRHNGGHTHYWSHSQYKGTLGPGHCGCDIVCLFTINKFGAVRVFLPLLCERGITHVTLFAPISKFLSFRLSFCLLFCAQYAWPHRVSTCYPLKERLQPT